MNESNMAKTIYNYKNIVKCIITGIVLHAIFNTIMIVFSAPLIGFFIVNLLVLYACCRFLSDIFPCSSVYYRAIELNAATKTQTDIDVQSYMDSFIQENGIEDFGENEQVGEMQ